MSVTLGKREHDVMTALWDHGPGTVSEVRARLGTELAYTTVLTILRNLEAKEAVGHRVQGRAHQYHALVAREEARESALARLIDGFFAGRPEALLTHLVDARRLSHDDLEALRRQIDRERGEPGGGER
jgi:BlaI family transcriptional regulator, penicillinase repressor